MSSWDNKVTNLKINERFMLNKRYDDIGYVIKKTCSVSKEKTHKEWIHGISTFCTSLTVIWWIH